jgi:hypothetical protein
VADGIQRRLRHNSRSVVTGRVAKVCASPCENFGVAVGDARWYRVGYIVTQASLWSSGGGECDGATVGRKW